MAKMSTIYQEYKTPITIGLVVFCSLLLAIAVLFLWGKIKNLVKKGANVMDIGTIAASVEKKNLSYPVNQYIIFADNLFMAMDDGDAIGTDEQTIYDVFSKMNTDDDVAQLITAFGIREIDGFFTSKELTLGQALRDELNASELKKLNNILKSKGISISF